MNNNDEIKSHETIFCVPQLRYFITKTPFITFYFVALVLLCAYLIFNNSSARMNFDKLLEHLIIFWSSNHI